MNGKTALITGCSRGIGLGLVKEFVNRGYNIIATARAPDCAQELQAFLKEHGQVPALTLDVASQSSIQSCKDMVMSMSQFSQLDILVNNAGVSNENHPGKVWRRKYTHLSV